MTAAFRQERLSIRDGWHRFVAWAKDRPILRASTAFVIGEGAVESIFIIAACIGYIASGNWWFAALFALWATWEVFARAIVVKQVL